MLAGHVDAVQDHVGDAEHVRQRLFLHAADAGLQGFFVVGGFDVVLAHVFDGAGEKAAGAAGGIEHGFAELGVDHSTMNWVTARGV